MIVEKKVCERCAKPFASLVNNELCIKCYQADYYKRVTKKKRKIKKRNKSKVWWLNP